jgi:hemerythrin superfamily protein
MTKRYTVTVDEELDKILDCIKGVGTKKATKIMNIVKCFIAIKYPELLNKK